MAQSETSFVCPSMEMGPAMPPAPDRSGAPLMIEAREIDAGRTRAGELRGNVELTRADQRIETERLLFDPVEQVITVPEPIAYRDQQIWLQGKEAHYDLVGENGHFSWVDFGLSGSSAHGSARLAELEGGHTSRLYELDYTTCPGDDPDWRIEMKELELRHNEGMGDARGGLGRQKKTRHPT